jgi:hypothetical protein
MPGLMDFVSPLTAMPDLDNDADDAPHRFRAMQNILGSNSIPCLVDRGVVEDLLAAIREELGSADEALKVKEWHLAMMEELVSIEENQAWSLVHMPKGHRAIGLKWVFKPKQDENVMSSGTKPSSLPRDMYSDKGLISMNYLPRLQGWSQCGLCLQWKLTMIGKCITWTSSLPS